MTRELHYVPLADLKLSKLNVRRHGAKEIDGLAASIAALGLIQPLLVRPEDGGFEIVAGQRRYLALKKLNAEGTPETDAVPCIVMDGNDDTAALESSLAENVARLPMDEIDQYEAFAALKKRGLDEDEIAAHFAIPVQMVKRRLAIANLHPDIRRLYRAGEIDAKTVQLLTLATKQRQKAWLALYRDPEQSAPPPWQLKAWLLGGAEISTKAALFDEALYRGAIAADLFGEARYFTDPDEFWRLQNAAIAEERGRLLAAGWAEVHVAGPDQRFQVWDHDKVSKAKGGAVYIEIEPDGHVHVHKGLGPRHAHPSSRSNGPASDPAGSASAARPEMSGPLANYVDLVRHNAVRLAVADAPQLALRLMLAHIVGGGTLWHVKPEPQRPATTVIGEAIAALPSHAVFVARQQEMLAVLGLDGDNGSIVQADRDGTQTAAIFARLRDLSEVDILSLVAVVMAETLAAGTQLIDTLGTALGVDAGAHWQPNDTFFTLVKDREAVSAMLAEVIGGTAAAAYLSETSTRKKARIRKALAGNGRARVEAWTSRYMAFPQAGYSSRPLTTGSRAGA